MADYRPKLDKPIEVTFMSRRLDYGHDFRKRQAAYGLSVKDEAEWMQDDAAARWLRRNGKHTSQKGDPRPAAKKRSSSEKQLRPRQSQKKRHADLDPCDPHDQVAGVDMKQIPWI